MINKVFLSGYVGDNVYENATQSGKRMINFSVNQEVVKNWNGQESVAKEFHKVTLFGEDIVLGPGDYVMVEGRLTNFKNKKGEYEKGITASKVEIIAQKSSNATPSFEQKEVPF